MKSDQEIWELVGRGGPIDANALLRALIDARETLSSDARSRMLRRDTIGALSDHWGSDLLRRRLSWFGAESILDEAPDAPAEGGFTTIRERLVDATNPESLFQMLRELGERVSAAAEIVVGGSLALMLDSLIVRKTEDVDLVDEVPAAFRHEHELLAELTRRFGLTLTHFQSHYLPENWRSRIRSLGRFGKIDAFVVDSLDILAGKLFSKRTKDLDDVRAAWTLIDRDQFRERLARSTSALRSDPDLLAAAGRNWYILTGEQGLPAAST
jgi:hypothetical protein